MVTSFFLSLSLSLFPRHEAYDVNVSTQVPSGLDATSILHHPPIQPLTSITSHTSVATTLPTGSSRFLQFCYPFGVAQSFLEFNLMQCLSRSRISNSSPSEWMVFWKPCIDHEVMKSQISQFISFPQLYRIQIPTSSVWLSLSLIDSGNKRLYERVRKRQKTEQPSSSRLNVPKTHKVQIPTPTHHPAQL